MWYVNETNPIIVISPSDSDLKAYYKKQGEDGDFTELPITFDYKEGEVYEALHSFDTVGKYIIKVTNLTISKDMYALVNVVPQGTAPTATEIANEVWGTIL